MRKILIFTNVSLDGYFEDRHHTISAFKNDSEAFSRGPEDEVDTILLGHKTYEMMKFWSTPQAAETAPEIARFFNENLKVVVSRKPFEPGWQNVLVFSDDVTVRLKMLKEQPGKNIIVFGSNTLCLTLLQEGLVDVLQLVVNPVLFGEGSSLFKGLAGNVELTLVESHPYKSGAILLRYEPVK